MCDCLLSTRIEMELFDKFDNNIPDEDCPICLDKLTINSLISCCGGYARKLNCGHYVHVNCQINKNPDLIHCSVCRAQLTSTDIYYKICRAKILNKLPIGYFKLYNNNQLNEKMINDLKIYYDININELTETLNYLDNIKSNDGEIYDFFKILWSKNY